MQRLIAFFLLCAVSAMAQTANVTYYFSDFGLNPQAVKRATLTPIAPFGDYAGKFLVASPLAGTTASDGSVTFSNIVTGYAYKIQIDTPYGSTYRTSGFPASVSGNVNGYVYRGAINNQTFFYAEASTNTVSLEQVNALIAAASGPTNGVSASVVASLIASSNSVYGTASYSNAAAFTTPNQVVAIASTNGGSLNTNIVTSWIAASNAVYGTASYSNATAFASPLFVTNTVNALASTNSGITALAATNAAASTFTNLGGVVNGSTNITLNGNPPPELSHANGAVSHVEGSGNTATGTASFAAGLNNTAQANMSAVFGNGNTASGVGSFSAGVGNTASGYSASSFGTANTAQGINSFVIGNQNLAIGPSSVAIGAQTLAMGGASFTAGQKAVALYDTSFCINLSGSTEWLTNKNESSFLLNAPNGIVLQGSPIVGDGGGITNAPYVASNVLSATVNSSITNTAIVKTTNKLLILDGTSTMAGGGAVDGASFATQISGFMATRGWDVRNFAVSGDVMTNILNRVTNIINLHPDAVLLAVGFNEHTFNWPGVTPQLWRSNVFYYAKLLSQNNIQVVFCTSWPQASASYPFLNVYKNVLSRELEASGYPLIDWAGSNDDGSSTNTDWALLRYDELHVLAGGHTNFFHAVNPSIFNYKGKQAPIPTRTGGALLPALGVTNGSAFTFRFYPFFPKQFTAACWFRVPQTNLPDPAQWDRIISIQETNSTGGNRIRVNGDGTITATDGTAVTTSFSVLDLQWHHVAVTHTEACMGYGWSYATNKLYVDGNLIGSYQCSGWIQGFNLEKITFGGQDVNSGPYQDGPIELQDLAVYRTVLLPEQISCLYNGKVPRASLEYFAPLTEQAWQVQGQDCANLAIPCESTMQMGNSPVVFKLSIKTNSFVGNIKGDGAGLINIPTTGLSTNGATAGQFIGFNGTNWVATTGVNSGLTYQYIDTSTGAVSYVYSGTSPTYLIKTNATYDLTVSYGTTTNVVTGDNVMIELFPGFMRW